MALPREHLGEQVGRLVATVDPERARAYAAATNDENAAYADARWAPPVFGVVPTWDALFSVVADLVPLEHRPMLLHAEHDMRFHRPLRPGMTLDTRAEGHNVRVARSGTWVTVRTVSEDEGGALVLEQFATMFVRGMTGGDSWGPDRPGHAFPAEARESPLGEVVRHVDDDQTYRYRDASGDENRIHIDDEFARSVKLPGIVLHGLCTMAMCGAVVVDQLAAGDPARLARLAVRFSKPVLPGSDLVVGLYRAGLGLYAFEALSDGKLVVRDGLAEVRD